MERSFLLPFLLWIVLALIISFPVRGNSIFYFEHVGVFNSTISFNQGAIKGKVVGLAEGDSATVRIQKSNEKFFFKILPGNGGEIPFSFENLEEGKWALSIDAKGYVFPTAKVLELNNNVLENTITLVKSDEVDQFSYSWQDDESYVGHAQQTYINDVVEIEILGEKEKIPDDFSAIYLYNQFGFLLSDEEGVWTSEEAYRLFQLVQRLPFERFGEGGEIKVNAKWLITDQFIDKDISYSRMGDIDIVRISRVAFTYATPQVVTVDGVKGKFFSKRLFNALVYYHTAGGFDVGKLDNLARERYGIEFLQPGESLRDLMGETESNFQAFTPEEKIIIISMLEEFPDPMQRQEGLKYLVRRINGQQHPIYPQAPAIAWTGLKTIEFMEMAFKDMTIEYMQRLVLHEKAHFLWEYTFDQKTKDDWAEIGDWYLEPTSASGWATTNTTEFVSAYAHAINPNEDMAESIAYYITNPEKFRSRSLRKFEFVRDRIMNGTRYISVIRPDLTFEVFNLFPDYFYPGKIIRTKLDVLGGPEEDKKVIFEIELNTYDNSFGGATAAQCRLVSSIGTIVDMWLNPVNSQGSILRGELSLSKFVKSGYWNIPQITIWDNVGNTRLENNSTYGVKVFINNPLEDVQAPFYVQNSLQLEKVTGQFSDITGEQNPENGIEMQAVRLNFEIEEKNTIQPHGRVLARLFFPELDQNEANQSPPYSRDVQISKIINDLPDSLKKVDFYFPVPDYYPSGYYSMSFLLMTDLALNTRFVYFDTDTLNTNFFVENGHQRSIRDSIYVETSYPDYKPPILDINDIRISATPTNLDAPNGETNFEMKLWIKDESDYPEKASGFLNGYFTLRDPQGAEYNYEIFDVNNFYDVNPDESALNYKEYTAKALLPAGSPPGIWGVSSITLFDKAGNRKFYSFVEFVRFDVETSDELQVNPMVEFLDKIVNASNVEQVSVKIACGECKNQNYRLRIYSSMGGDSQVFEGKMMADTTTLENLNLIGVNDGVLYATVFILDDENALIGVGKAEYTKDTVIPKAKSIQANLSSFGISNLDDLIVEIETEEFVGNYVMNLSQYSTNSSSSEISNSRITLTGSFTDGQIVVSELPLDQFDDGFIQISVLLIDMAGNESNPIEYLVYKDTKRPQISMETLSENDLDISLLLEVNEYVKGDLDQTKIQIQNGNLTSIARLENNLYQVELSRDCFQTLKIGFEEGMVVDTVSNLSSTEEFTFEKDWTPTIKTKNLTIELDETGKARLNPSDFDDGSIGFCGDLTFEISEENLSCTDLGENKLFLSIIDASGTKYDSEVQVVVLDNISPEIHAKSNYTLRLDEEGNAKLKWEDIDEGSIDNCEISERILSKTDFNIADGIDHKVIYTVTDGSGNSSSTEVNVRVDIILAVSENIPENDLIKYYPNPVSDFLTIEFGKNFNQNSIRNVELIDASGKKIDEISFSNLGEGKIGIEMGRLKSGIYYLRIVTLNSSNILKIVVVH